MTVVECPMGLNCESMTGAKNELCSNYESCCGLTEAWSVTPTTTYNVKKSNMEGKVTRLYSVTEVSFGALNVPENYDSSNAISYRGNVTPAIKRDLRNAGWDEVWGIPFEYRDRNGTKILEVDFWFCSSALKTTWLIAEGFMEAVKLPYTGIPEDDGKTSLNRGMIVTANLPGYGWMEAVHIEDSKPY